MPVREREEPTGDEECPVCMRPFHEFDVDSGSYIVKNDIGPQLHMYQCNHAVCQDCWNRSAASSAQALRVCPECRAQPKPGLAGQPLTEAQIPEETESQSDEDSEITQMSSDDTESEDTGLVMSIPSYNHMWIVSIVNGLRNAVCQLILRYVAYAREDIYESIHYDSMRHARLLQADPFGAGLADRQLNLQMKREAAGWLFDEIPIVHNVASAAGMYYMPTQPIPVHPTDSSRVTKVLEQTLRANENEFYAQQGERDTMYVDRTDVLRPRVRSWEVIMQLVVTSESFRSGYLNIEPPAGYEQIVKSYQLLLKRYLLHWGVFKVEGRPHELVGLRPNIPAIIEGVVNPMVVEEKLNQYIQLIQMLGTVSNHGVILLGRHRSLWMRNMVLETMNATDVRLHYDRDDELALINEAERVGFEIRRLA